jgi:hypothetical protein
MNSTYINEHSENHEALVDELNSLLRGELAAVATYRETNKQFPHSMYSSHYMRCENSHQRRVNSIRSEIVRLGGTPVDSSGSWGALAKIVTKGADLLGETTAIAVLEQGEDVGVADYRAERSELHLSTRRFIATELAPEQLRTHEIMSSLKKSLN